MYGPMILCESSNIHSIGFDPGGPTLKVCFHTKQKGGVPDESSPRREYEYYEVTEGLFQEFLASPSKGSFFASRVKGRFVTRRVQ
jgi:hypothetical protein